MRGTIEAIVGYQALRGTAGRDSIHWKIRNNLLGLEGGPLYGCIDASLEPLRDVNSHIADTRLKVHVQIAVDIFRDKMDDDIAGSRRRFDPSAGAVKPNIAGLGVTLERTTNTAACDRATGRFCIDSRGIPD